MPSVEDGFKNMFLGEKENISTLNIEELKN
jgi:hypothetical protein